jgi:enoyl-CoA hydratase
MLEIEGLGGGVSDIVLYEASDAVARITMNRPEFRNAQNSAMTYALDRAFYVAAQDDDIRVIVLAGAGDHFSAGHDIGSPGRDVDRSFPRVGMWWDHVGTSSAEGRIAREHEVYLDMCLRWRDIPKPTIAMVQGACIAGGLALAWICDLVVAADDAYFADPVIRMGAPGIEFFAHPWELGPRVAKEFLLTGDPLGAERARDIGMVNRVVARDALEAATLELARKIASIPRMALALTKQAVNRAQDGMGFRLGIDTAFALHQLAHAHSSEVSGDPLHNETPGSMARAARPKPS